MAAVSHSFDVWTESPASVEQIHATFGREDYWLTRLGAGDAVTTLDSLVVATDGLEPFAVETGGPAPTGAAP